MASGFVSNNIFAYAFATPNVSTSVSALPNIHNVVNPEDFVPKAPLEKWGFGKHGVVHELPSLSNTEMSSYDQLHSLMNDHFKKLVGEDHLNYTGAAETSEFIANVGNYAPTVQAYYETRHGVGQLTTYEYFMKLAGVVGGGGDIADFSTASASFPDLAGYLIAGGLLSPRIFHAHGPETYLSWLKAFSS